ncbi:hypothetical protein H6G27_32905 [Nostoc linckia FACHB-104]|nr:hypothetical protein [Nostoc linckia FACHB-104]
MSAVPANKESGASSKSFSLTADRDDCTTSIPKVSTAISTQPCYQVLALAQTQWYS